jgi:hypothetical protein
MTAARPKAQISDPPPPAQTPPADAQESFVINLCSSTTPMALTQPQLAQLKRYTFFVSRRLEDGRERFRLHMGYFDSLVLAEELLPVVREIYPGAWAGEAPGKRLRARAATASPAAAPTKPVPAPATPSPAATPAVAPTAPPPTLVAAPSAHIPANPPTLAAAPNQAPEPRLPKPTPAADAQPKAVTRPAPPRRPAGPAIDERSNVRAVLKSLDEPASPPSLPVVTKPATTKPVTTKPVTTKPVTTKPTATMSATPGTPVPRQPGVLPESQVLRLLEEKRSDPLNTTSTPAAFAVQLHWSVQPIDLARVPPLAIFGAYTLYTVEGSREGRRWYGLRLGFFSDANSAKQVAQYVRSEFATVAVVPVSLKERDGASGAAGGASAANPTTERLPDQSAEFKLLDDTTNTPKLPASAVGTASTGAASPAADGGSPAAKPRVTPAGKSGIAARAGQKSAKGRGHRVDAREKRGPKTLEETLEILGADQLQIEGARKGSGAAGGVRHTEITVQKNSALSRLLERLAERGR